MLLLAVWQILLTLNINLDIKFDKVISVIAI